MKADDFGLMFEKYRREVSRLFDMTIWQMAKAHGSRTNPLFLRTKVFH